SPLLLRFLRRSQVTKLFQEQQIVSDLQGATDDQWPGLEPTGEEGTRDSRTSSSGETARYRREAGSRRSLGWRHHSHHVGRARRHVHLREGRSDEEKDKRNLEVWRESGENQAHTRGNVGEDHRVDEPNPLR